MNNLTTLDLIAIISFILQLDNNEELNIQTSNDEILKQLHNDIMQSIEDNRKIYSKIISQNDDIINKLEVLLNAQSKRN
jgi:hypothetical protein